MKTHLSYFEDTYKFDDQAMIIASNKDEAGHFIVLNQTIFYPQGGGQPSDQGVVEVGNIAIPIHKVKSVDNEVRHYTNQDYSHLVGQACRCIINSELRLINAKLHTSGHLLSNAFEAMYPQCRAVKGHHFPGESYVEFSVQNGLDVQEIDVPLLNSEIEGLIRQDLAIQSKYIASDELANICPNLPYSIPEGRSVRLVAIDSFDYQPCGGTHVKSLSELEGLQIIKYKIKGGSIKISYSIL